MLTSGKIHTACNEERLIDLRANAHRCCVTGIESMLAGIHEHPDQLTGLPVENPGELRMTAPAAIVLHRVLAARFGGRCHTQVRMRRGSGRLAVKLSTPHTRLNREFHFESV